MTRQLQLAVAELEAMAGQGNRHAVNVLRDISEELRDRFDHAEVKLAVMRARRSLRHWEEDCRDEAEAVKVVRIDLAGREAEYSVN